jgi:hypothetical protein
MLQGGAFDWWGVHKNKYTEEVVITWKLFKEEFYKKYFPESVQWKMELAFSATETGKEVCYRI